MQGFGRLATPSGLESVVGGVTDETVESPTRHKQIAAFKEAANPENSLLRRGASAAAGVLSQPVVIVEEVLIIPLLDVPVLSSEAGRDISRAIDSDNSVDRIVHSLEATKKLATAAGTLLGIASATKLAVQSVARNQVVASAEQQVIAAGEREAAASINLTEAEASNLTRFNKRLPKENLGTHVDELGDGVMFTSEVPGKVPGSKAVYQKTVDSNGVTTGMTKTTFGPQGNVVHIKDKLAGEN